MILQSLHSYYQRLQKAQGHDVAPEGFAPQKIGFALLLDVAGNVLDVLDLRDKAEKGNRLLPRCMTLPSLGQRRSVNIKSNFLWGGSGYVLGKDDRGKPERTAKCHNAFKKLHYAILSSLDLPEFDALLAFLDKWNPEKFLALPHWEDLVTTNIVFRVGSHYLHEMSDAHKAWVRHMGSGGNTPGVCLVTGDTAGIAALHPAIKGVRGAQSTGASLSSFNCDSFKSYNKEQNINAPVGKSAAFAYTTALNYLITRKEQSLIYGQTTVICWAEKPCILEDVLFAFVATPKAKEVDVSSAQQRATILRGMGQGLPVGNVWPELEQDVEMHILALAPNVSRLSVSFYLRGMAQEFLQRINAYFQELSLHRQFEVEPEFPSVWQIGKAVLGPHKKMQDVKRLGEDILRAVLSGGRYPEYLLPMCLQRLRSGDCVNSVRAGLIKAMLIRNHHCEVDMSLNPDHSSSAYHLGRIFALLLGVQHKAVGLNINADIRDKYYGSASSTPAMVFPILLRNAQNHIKKASAFGYDKMMREILDKIHDHFPPHLNLVQQGEFALGYYHQRSAKTLQQDVETPTVKTK